MRIGYYFKQYSENIGGAIGLLGSAVFSLTGGGASSVTASGLFLAGGVLLMTVGNKTKGYCAGAVTLVVGDVFAACAMEGDPVAQGVFLVHAGCWSVGALRLPFEAAAKRYNNESCQLIADTLPAICGVGNAGTRLVGLFSQVAAVQVIRAGCFAAWAVADCLAGRVPQKAAQIIAVIRRDGDAPEVKGP